jgi:predicted nuclease of predicted toxin-antitoxin system
LDEDLPPLVAEVARGLDVDVRSVHELGRTGLSDPEQLRFAAGEGRVFVTRNRNDFLHFTVEFFRKGEPHSGVLIVSRSLPSSRPERISHALRRWEQSRKNNPGGFGPYAVDFLS